MVTPRGRGDKNRKGKPPQRKRKPATGSKARRQAPPGTRRKRKVVPAKDGKKGRKRQKKKDAKRPRTIKRRTPKLQNPSGGRRRKPRKSTRPTKQTSRYQASSSKLKGVSTNTTKLALKTLANIKKKKLLSNNRKGKFWDKDRVEGVTADEDRNSSTNQTFGAKLSRASSLHQGPRNELVRGISASGPNTPRRDAFRPNQRTWSNLSDDSDSDDDDVKTSSSCRPLSLLNTRRNKMTARTGLADIDPMAIDLAVGFHSIGGLAGHISALKEMVVFPLLYPEVFDNFKIQPPRGCLFYGPPGTGKTLVARALANECSHGNRTVSFFMRKGADCLSKWVGESERQLRLLFEQAYLKRPSIIFFDEIDGLAPVRTSRQDHTHSSIVSTLLALMDGLDSRGEVVVIGATNRLDSIDPALRRPGRFDREFLFSLPDRESRKEILKIHTRQWKPPPSEDFLDELAEKCVGYCGADIRAVCTEAALCALRRRYPQIYGTSEKLLLDVSSISVSSCDFVAAMRKMSPASHRSVASPAKPLSPVVHPLLGAALQHILEVLQRLFPHAEQGMKRKREPDLTSGILDDGLMCGGDESSATSSISAPSSSQSKNFLHFARSAVKQPTSYRPRMLLAGRPGSGQTSHLAPAVLHALERFTIHSLDSAVLFGVSSSSPEETCAQVFCEAKRTSPSILYIPHMQQWWETAGPALKASFLSLLGSIPSFSPILLLATCSVPYQQMDSEIQSLFREEYGEVYTISVPTRQERTDFFQDLILNQAAEAPPSKNKALTQTMEILPVAQLPPRRQLLEQDSLRLEEQEEDVLRELRLFLRNVTERLMLDRRFKAFTNPVDTEEVPDYPMVIKKPMDLSTLLTNINEKKYFTVSEFLSDADLIWQNALEYNPDTDPMDRHIRHTACALKNAIQAVIRDELDEDVERICEEMKESRNRRTRKKKPRKSKWSAGVLQKPKKKKSPVLASTSSSSTSSKASSVETRGMNDSSGTSSSSTSESSDGEHSHPMVTMNGYHRRLNTGTPKVLMNGHHNLKQRNLQPAGSVPKRRLNLRHQTQASKTTQAPQLMLNGVGLNKLERRRKGNMQLLNRDKCAEVLDKDTPQLVVDDSKLKNLLSRAVAKTEGAEVDQLEKLYALLAQCIYRHRNNYNKTMLIKEMGTEINSFS